MGKLPQNCFVAANVNKDIFDCCYLSFYNACRGHSKENTLYVVILRTYSVIRALTLITILCKRLTGACRKTNSFFKKITKDKWRITESYITKHNLNYRAFHRLNHSLAPNRTGDITIFKTCCHPALLRSRRQIDLPASGQNRNLLLRQMLR